jgi:RHO1 GDP-GTP exchange protein 1/2
MLTHFKLPAAFRKVLDSNEPKSIIAIPEFDKFLVQCDSALYSYPLDMIVLIAQGSATPGSIIDSEEKLAGDRRDVLFFRAGRLANRTISE